MTNRWNRIRDSFWFLPAVLSGLAVVIAETLIAVDRTLGDADLGPFTFLVNRIGEAGSRDVLGSIAGSVLGVAATSFSITIAVLATASSTYGPRLVRNFMADRGNQFVLGVFAATFLYCLLVLRSIRETGGDYFVPHLAVNLAVLLAVASIGVLVYFINHIAASVQVHTLARRVRLDLVAAIDLLYPEELGSAPEEVGTGGHDVPHGLRIEGVTVPATRPGYVNRVADERLLDLARAHDLVLCLQVQPGSHLVAGQGVALAWPPDRVTDEVRDRIAACFATAESRTPHQDVDYAVLVLEEMAVRALSPSTNDPYTAINALDDLTVGLVRLVGRPLPSAHRYDDSGELRIVATRVVPVQLVDRVFDAMRWHATGHPSVLHRTLDLAGSVAAASVHADIGPRLVEHARRIVEAYERSSPQRCDLDELRRHAAELEAAVVGRTPVH
ncbi:DUF2254 domain-containing protein [Pseudonocardia sp.]|uniref:DUF2254 domain-containing protein n=1 Tax=Pseudonocardia sp. TaxID=60912 RepID=UPI002617ACDB|nr:DUF2254 domain-containing protein [Pseudonocardia sp.]